MDMDAARTEIRNRGFDYLTDSRLNTFLNTASTEMDDAYPWPWLETTTTGTAPLTVTDLKNVLYVVNTSNECELLSLEFRDRVLGDPNLTQSGAPAYWSLDGLNTIVLWPATSVDLSVRYVKTSPVLSDAADEPLFPEQYHGVWVDRAVVECLKDSDNHEAANVLLGDVGRRVQQMVMVYGSRNAVYQRVDVFSALDW